MPRRLNSQLPPKGPLLIGMRSPTFQPKRSAVARPAMAPCRSARKARHSSSPIRNSGYIVRQLSTSIANWAKKFFSSWYTPPNQLGEGDVYPGDAFQPVPVGDWQG